MMNIATRAPLCREELEMVGSPEPSLAEALDVKDPVELIALLAAVGQAGEQAGGAWSFSFLGPPKQGLNLTILQGVTSPEYRYGYALTETIKAQPEAPPGYMEIAVRCSAAAYAELLGWPGFDPGFDLYAGGWLFDEEPTAEELVAFKFHFGRMRAAPASVGFGFCSNFDFDSVTIFGRRAKSVLDTLEKL